MEKIANVSKKINHGFHRLSCHAHETCMYFTERVYGVCNRLFREIHRQKILRTAATIK